MEGGGKKRRLGTLSKSRRHVGLRVTCQVDVTVNNPISLNGKETVPKGSFSLSGICLQNFPSSIQRETEIPAF